MFESPRQFLLPSGFLLSPSGAVRHYPGSLALAHVSSFGVLLTSKEDKKSTHRLRMVVRPCWPFRPDSLINQIVISQASCSSPSPLEEVMKVLFLNPKHLLESLGDLSKLLCPGLTPKTLTYLVCHEPGHCHLLNVSQVTLLCAHYSGSHRPCLMERPLCKSIQ